MQLLEGYAGTQWHLFRKWGRVGDETSKSVGRYYGGKDHDCHHEPSCWWLSTM